MAAITFEGMTLTGDHASRPAATAVGAGSIYACSTHSLIYQSDGSSWATWATLGGDLSDTGVITYLDGTVAAAPSTPAAGKLRIYAKTGKVLAVKDDAGTETVLGQGIADQGAITYLDATEAAAPSTPAAGKVRVYAKTDGLLYSKDDAGTETALGSSGGGGASDPILTQFGTPDVEFNFDGSSLAGLTAMGALDSSNEDTSIADHFYGRDNDAAQQGYYDGVSGACSAVLEVAAHTMTSEHQYLSIFAGEATPGKLVTAGLYVGAAAVTTARTIARTWANPTDSSPGSPTLASNPVAGRWASAFMGISAVSDTDISYYISENGKAPWYPILLNHNNSMTLGSIGFSMGVYGGGAAFSTAVKRLWIWNSAKTFVI